MNRFTFAFAIAAVALVFAAPSWAAVVYTDNFGTGADTTPAVGWTLNSGNGGAYNPLNAQYAGATADDNRMGWVGVTLGGQQSINPLALTILANTTYTLDFVVGNRADFGHPTSAFLELRAASAAGTVLASANVGTTGLAPGEGALSSVLQISFNSSAFVPQVGSALYIVMRTAVTGQVNLDNLSLDATANPIVPAPAALPAGLGLIGLAAMRRRRRID